MSEPAPILAEGRCPICASPTFGAALCWTCVSFREYAEPARALCDFLHRGILPKTKPAPMPAPTVEGP